MNRHPYSELFSALDLSPEALRELGDDIQAHGLHSPITAWHGQIIDGWNRYQACLLSKTEPSFHYFSGTAKEAWEWILSHNLYRKDRPSAKERAIIFLRYQELAPENPQPLQTRPDGQVFGNHGNSDPGELDDDEPSSHPPPPPLSRSEVQAQFDLSLGTAQRAIAISASNDPELKKAVIDGAISLERGAAISKLAPEERKQAITAPPKPSTRSQPPPAMPEDHGPDMAEELAAAHKEILRLQADLESYAKTDRAKELKALLEKYNAVNARVHQLLVTQGELERKIRRQDALLKKLRECLGVERNGQILDAVKAR